MIQRDNANWENVLPAEHPNVYKCVLEKMCAADVPFALGGGLALSVYTGCVRGSKDIDLYVLPKHRLAVIDILTGCGLQDYYSVKEYVRHWIYRGYVGEAIVDVIWAMANQRAEVDERWVTGGSMIRMFGTELRVVPVEELIWSKLYVLQRDRCDWPDILNLLNATAATVDWDHLLERVAEDSPLVKGLLSVFSWLCPVRARSVPRRIWDRLGVAPAFSDQPPAGRPNPEDLLDTRPWLLDKCAA
jgi:hypothetical protein